MTADVSGSTPTPPTDDKSWMCADPRPCGCTRESGCVRQGSTPTLDALAAKIHAQNRKWWYGPDGERLNRNKGELLMLVVTEVAEAMEGERKNLMDDKLPHRRMAEVEVVDAIVRLLDYAAGFGYELDAPLAEKLAYNAQRTDHKQEAAMIADFVKVERWECQIACGQLLTAEEIKNHGCELTPDQKANAELRNELRHIELAFGNPSALDGLTLVQKAAKCVKMLANLNAPSPATPTEHTT
jgi:hypothetical protein